MHSQFSIHVLHHHNFLPSSKSFKQSFISFQKCSFVLPSCLHIYRDIHWKKGILYFINQILHFTHTILVSLQSYTASFHILSQMRITLRYNIFFFLLVELFVSSKDSRTLRHQMETEEGKTQEMCVQEIPEIDLKSRWDRHVMVSQVR